MFSCLLWRNLFNEDCLCSFLLKAIVGVFLPDLQWIAVKAKPTWLMFFYFVPLLCSSCILYSSSPLFSFFLATRRWRSGCQRCGGRGDKPKLFWLLFFFVGPSCWDLSCHPVTAPHRDETLNSFFLQQSKSFLSCKDMEYVQCSGRNY